MEKVLRFIGAQALRSRAGFAAFTYLAAGVLLLSFLAGLVVTGTNLPGAPTSQPQAAATATSEPDVTVRQQRVPEDEPAATMQAEPTASPTEEPTPAPQPVRRVAPPRPTPVPKAESPAPTPAVVAEAQIGITDSGIYPKQVTIIPGGTVTWINQGSLVHTATRVSDAPFKLDTGGLAAGQSASLKLFDPGTYQYTSATDCLAGANDGFDCSGATITVVPPSHPAALALKAVTDTTSAVNVDITDAGFVPASVTVKSGGAVTFTNQGTTVHTATATAGGKLFDSGGLAPHQSAKVNLASPGTFTYTSAPDCLKGNKSAAFGCGRTFTVVVTD